MYDNHSGNLPDVFRVGAFTQVKCKHSYNTKLASSKKNQYGRFNIRCTGAKECNEGDEIVKNA